MGQALTFENLFSEKRSLYTCFETKLSAAAFFIPKKSVTLMFVINEVIIFNLVDNCLQCIIENSEGKVLLNTSVVIHSNNESSVSSLDIYENSSLNFNLTLKVC